MCIRDRYSTKHVVANISHICVHQALKLAFASSISNVLNILSDRRFLLAVCIKPPKLNRRSTGAVEGIGVMYFRKSDLTLGYLCSGRKHVLLCSHYWANIKGSKSNWQLEQNPKIQITNYSWNSITNYKLVEITFQNGAINNYKLLQM